MIGETLGKYHIVEHLGSGSMADVYKAYQPSLDRYVAIKVLHSFLAEEEDFLTRFQREAKTVAMLRHPNIIQVHDCDFDAQYNAYYMVVEFIDGPSLKVRLTEMAEEGQVMPLEEAVRIVTTVADALDYAHQCGMIHRDVKPANIVLTQDGQVILADFGIAKLIDATRLTDTGAMVGTPAYMAPELGMGQKGDGRADVYSLGVVLYQLAVGQLPFEADTPLGVVLKHIHGSLTRPTALNPDLLPAIETVIMRALAKNPGHRYQTAGEFAADLKRAMAGEPIEPISPELTTASATLEGAAGAGGQDQAKQWEQSTMPSAPDRRPALVTPPLFDISAGRLRGRWIAVSAAVLILIVLCCGYLLVTEAPGRLLAALLSQAATPTPSVLGTPTSTPTPDLTATYEVVSTQFAAMLATYVATTGVTPTPSSTPTSTPAPDLTATAIAACVFDMEVVNSRRVWPGVLRPGQQFIRRWEIKNTGTCPWPDDVRLVFVSGDELEVVVAPEIEPLSPGETSELEVTLRAPRGYATYVSTWQLQGGQGNSIGEELEIAFRVGLTPTPRPTATTTATPTPMYSPTPMEPLRIDSVGIADWHTEEGGVWVADLYVVARGGDGQYQFYRDVIAADTEFFAPNPDEPWVGFLPAVRAQKDKDIWITFWVTSAGTRVKWEGAIPYPGAGD